MNLDLAIALLTVAAASSRGDGVGAPAGLPEGRLPEHVVARLRKAGAVSRWEQLRNGKVYRWLSLTEVGRGRIKMALDALGGMQHD